MTKGITPKKDDGSSHFAHPRVLKHGYDADLVRYAQDHPSADIMVWSQEGWDVISLETFPVADVLCSPVILAWMPCPPRPANLSTVTH